MIKSYFGGSSLVAQQGKDPVLSLLWHRFSPWPGNFCMVWVQPKKKKKKSNVFGFAYLILQPHSFFLLIETFIFSRHFSLKIVGGLLEFLPKVILLLF